MSLLCVESSGTLQETTHMFKVTTKVVSLKTVPKLHSVRCRTPWWPSCIMEANSSSSQLRDRPGSEGRDGQWILCCLGQLLTLVENWKHLRYPPVCGDGGGCSWKPLSISGKAEWRAWTPGEIHGTEAGRWSWGLAVLEKLKFILLQCGRKNGRKHTTWPSRFEKPTLLGSVLHSSLGFLDVVCWICCPFS